MKVYIMNPVELLNNTSIFEDPWVFKNRYTGRDDDFLFDVSQPIIGDETFWRKVFTIASCFDKKRTNALMEFVLSHESGTAEDYPLYTTPEVPFVTHNEVTASCYSWRFAADVLAATDGHLKNNIKELIHQPEYNALIRVWINASREEN